MSLTGPPKPTFLYPRIKFGSPAVTIDNAEPTSRIPTITPYTGLRGSNTVASGKTEYLFGRDEEQVGLALRCEQDQLAALRWFVKDFAARGSQFQAWVDRYSGSCWPFENNLKDQNGLALTLNGGGTETYAAVTNGTGITLAGAQYLSVALAQASAATQTGYDDPLNKDEGLIVVDWKAGHAATDNSQDRFFFDSTPTSNCRLSLYKTTATMLALQIVDSTNTAKLVQGTVAWSIGDRVQIAGSWTTAGALTLWYAVNSGAFVALASASGAGTGLLATLPATGFIGSGFGGANLTLGTYDTVALFDSAYVPVGGLTSRLAQAMSTFRPVERNYFPYAELTAAAFQPARVTLGRPIWDWPIMFRNGVAA